jgi:hypothetical protein
VPEERGCLRHSPRLEEFRADLRTRAAGKLRQFPERFGRGGRRRSPSSLKAGEDGLFGGMRKCDRFRCLWLNPAVQPSVCAAMAAGAGGPGTD